jgi:uncharacterized protein YbjT (DUF2867 family)
VTSVLVTGGTGTLGSKLLTRLAGAGHEVRSLSRHAPPAPVPGTVHVRGDVLTGEGLGDALAGVDTVIHTATSARLSRAVEVNGTANVVAAAAEVDAHVIYISIVGVDTMRYSYYEAKWDAEQAVESGPARWTIQRATQFHDLIDRFLGWRVFPVTRNLSFQPVDAGEVADRLVELVGAGPGGRVEDFGGPAVVPLRQLAVTRRRITGSSTVLVPVPAVGVLGQFDQGRHLCPDHARGRTTWEQWLQERPRR